MECMDKTIYIAGPMRNYPKYNFPAFFHAESALKVIGFSVINPARMDIELDGFHPANDEPREMSHYMRRDIPAIAKSNAIALLTGWEESEGVGRELTAAGWFDVPAWPIETILDAGGLPSCPPVRIVTASCTMQTKAEIKAETILEEAARITSIDRQQAYDSPLPNHQRIAAMWNGYLSAIGHEGVTLTPHDVARMMIMLKIARDVYRPKRDNLVDIAGYARCLETMQEEN